MASTELKKPNFYPGSAEKVNGDLSFETNSLANNSFTLGQKHLGDFQMGQMPPTDIDYPLRSNFQGGGGGFISIKQQTTQQIEDFDDMA